MQLISTAVLLKAHIQIIHIVQYQRSVLLSAVITNNS